LHVLTIDGSSLIGLGNAKFIDSATFDVGGHGWCIIYFPNGDCADNADWISIFLTLLQNRPSVPVHQCRSK
ncbi:hypothetical protein BAE44_0015952, partial [Dichanthelium oligosanthes]